MWLCGSFKQCYNKKCCQQDCKFQGDVVCNTGPCCTNCTYSELWNTLQNNQSMSSRFLYAGWITLYWRRPLPSWELHLPHSALQRNLGRHASNSNDECDTIYSRGRWFGHCTRDDRFWDSMLMCQWPKVEGWQVSMSLLSSCVEGVSSLSVRGVRCLVLGIRHTLFPRNNWCQSCEKWYPGASGKFCLDNSCNATIEAINYDCDHKVCNHKATQ